MRAALNNYYQRNGGYGGRIRLKIILDETRTALFVTIYFVHICKEVQMGYRRNYTYAEKCDLIRSFLSQFEGAIIEEVGLETTSEAMKTMFKPVVTRCAQMFLPGVRVNF